MAQELLFKMKIVESGCLGMKLCYYLLNTPLLENFYSPLKCKPSEEKREVVTIILSDKLASLPRKHSSLISQIITGHICSQLRSIYHLLHFHSSWHHHWRCCSIDGEKEILLAPVYGDASLIGTISIVVGATACALGSNNSIHCRLVLPTKEWDEESLLALAN